MVDNIATKPLGLVLIVTAHMVFNGPSKAEVTAITGILGSNITLKFTFFGNNVIDHRTHFAVYRTGHKKIAESINCSKSSIFEVHPKDNSVLYHITNLKQNDSQMYWATLFGNSLLKESNRVQLDVREENKSSTVPPVPTNITKNEESGSSNSFSFHIITVLVVSPVVLLAAVFPCVIWCLVRTKDSPPQQNSNPTLQETIESNNVPPPSVIYSALDFPKRPSAVLEMNPNDTEYAAVHYLSENRFMYS